MRFFVESCQIIKMKKLFTKVGRVEYPFKIGYEKGIMFWGSCFSEHIYERLKRFQFDVLSNPFGISYNPVSIAEGMNCLLSKKFINEENLIINEERYYAYDFHGSFSGNTPERALSVMNESIRKGAAFLRKTKILILTLGTANAFYLKDSNQIVNNCHKMPGSHFDKKMLSVAEVYQALSGVFERLPEMQILLTVSPVRHIRDGLVTNQRSKSTLLLAARQLADDHENVYYFPSYEIMVDELRDYRFYKDDLIHPSDWAVDYIWERFKTAFFDEETLSLQSRIEKLWIAGQHRPLYPDSDAHRAFVARRLELIKELEDEYPFLRGRIEGEG